MSADVVPSNPVVQRYSHWCLVTHGHDILPRDDGAWVRYDDVRAEIERLTKQRDEGWDAFYKLRKNVAEAKYPGMTGVVRALEAAPRDETAP